MYYNRNIIVSNLYILLIITQCLLSCDSDAEIESNEPSIPIVKPYISHFSFLAKDNRDLKEDLIINLGTDSITDAFVPNLATDSLVATFYGVYDSVKVGGGKN